MTSSTLHLALATPEPEDNPEVSARPLISDEFYSKYLITLVPPIQIFNIIGIISNIINIIVFTKLGRGESTNISLQALAVCDLIMSVLSAWTYTVMILSMLRLDLPFDPFSITILTGSGQWNFVVRWGAFITAYISLERCLCILKPLKVKRILTPKVTTMAVLVMLVVTVGPACYLHLKYKFVWKMGPQLNRTVLAVNRVKTPEVLLMGAIINAIAGLFQPIAAFVLVIVCTVYLGIYLNRASAWRRQTTSQVPQKVNSPGEGNQKAVVTSQKETRVIKLVVSIAIVFIVCVTPSTVHIFIMGVYPEFSFDAQFANAFMVLFILSCLGSSVNASVNIFIYYRMSSRYKVVFRQLMGLAEMDEAFK